ncbi:MAG: hypothetical protein Q8R92_03035 [Deltaproteobacteria bacterium]|nr:hypothetical protein [Deltaproteobacteria bacterium]
MLLSRVFPEVWKFGLHERATRQTPLALRGGVTAAAGVVRYTTLRKINAAAGYQVTAGKTLVITRILYTASAVIAPWTAGYGDDDVAFSSAVAPANAVGSDGSLTPAGNLLLAATANVIYDVDYYLEVPAGKYPMIFLEQASDTVRVYFLGHEV